MTPANSEITASTITSPVQNGEKGSINANGRYSAASEITSGELVGDTRRGRLFWPNSRASMPSIALRAMRRNIHSGMSRNGARRSGALKATRNADRRWR